jgi:hypothetical protein
MPDAGCSNGGPAGRLHWDACVPNTLIDAVGSALVTLTSGASVLRIAGRTCNRYLERDLEVRRRMGGARLNAYGIDPDPERIRYY